MLSLVFNSRCSAFLCAREGEGGVFQQEREEC